MLRDTLADIVSLRPDFFVGAEWDEENENTCFRPTVAHGFTHQRLLRYFHDVANNGGKTDVFPGDDTTLPNLVVSYRKELMAGEPLEVEVLNIPDGTFDGADITVAFAWKRPDGTVVRAFDPRRLKGGELMAAWFKEDVSKLVADPALVPELTVWAKGRKWTVSDGLWPVGLHVARCIEYKWTKQPIRDLPKGVVGSLKAVGKEADGALTIRATVKSPRRLRSVAVLDEADTVCLYDGRAARDVDTVRIRIAYQGHAFNGKNRWLNGEIRLEGAPGAQLRLGRSRGDIVIDGMAFRCEQAALNNWPRFLFAEVPRAEAESGVFTANVPGFFEGKVALKELLEKEVVALSGPNGGNLVFTVFRSQEAMPPPQLVNEADFTFRLKPGLRNSIVRLETVDEDYHVWRSSPLRFGKRTGETVTYNVYERDADRVSAVTVDSSRLERFSYVFEPSRGAVVAGGEGRNHWGLAGGAATLVTGFGFAESAGGNTAATLLSAKTPGVAKSAPDYVREPDGSWSLQFGPATYLSLPQQIWPVQAGFALEMVVCPAEVGKRQGLITTGATSAELWIENGRVHARFFLRNLFFRKSGREAGVVVDGPEIAAGKWQTVRLVCDQKTAYLEVDGVRGETVPVSGDLFYPLYTAVGLSQKDDFFTGRMKSLKVGVAELPYTVVRRHKTSRARKCSTPITGYSNGYFSNSPKSGKINAIWRL